jgi:hypothetical protein
MPFLDDFLNFLGNNLFERTLSIALFAGAAYLAYRWVIEPVHTTLHGMWNFWKMHNTKASFLEVTPPEHPEKHPVATQQLFAVLRQLTSDTETMSVEIVSSRKEGIRYLIRALPGDIPTIKRHIVSYLPEAQFRVLEDFTLPDTETTDKPNRVFEIKQSGHYAYPLQPHEDLEASDPVAYIAGAMTKLEADETIIMQMVLARHHSYWTARIINQIMTKGYAILGLRNKARYFVVGRWKIWLVAAVVGVLFNNAELALSVALLLVVISFFMPQEEPMITDGEKELYIGILQKLKQPLFRTDIRMLVVANSYDRLADLSNGVTSSLAPLNGEQRLHILRLYPDWLGQKIGKFKLVRRMPSFLVYDANILGASELASIYHFPYGTIATEGMARSHSRTLPAPILIKSRSDDSNFDVMLGSNNHHGETTDIGLTADERERHMYIIGGTGNGKTTLLQYAILQDIQNGKGVAVVDPHGDMAAKLLKYIPEERIKDVIYFNPADISNPIGLNLLELPEGLTDDKLLLAKDFVTESIVSVFRKIFSEDDSGGHRIEHVLRNAIHTAFAVEGATLFTIRKLLNNPEFRKKVVATLEDQDIKDFWINEFGLAGNYQKYKAMDGVTTKIGRFQRSVVTRRILEQEKSTIDFDEILNGKILICNLAKGSIGEDTSSVLGTAILTRLQLAAYRRINTREEDRRPFYLYVDEFQNFVSPLFIQILSESRKYKLFLTMAEQSTSQQDRELTENILDNAGTIVCFRTGNPADEELMLHQFKGYVEEGEITHLPKYNFYMRIAAGEAQEAFSGRTIVLESPGDMVTAARVVDNSREHYATKYALPPPSKNLKSTIKASETEKKQSTRPKDRLKMKRRSLK